MEKQASSENDSSDFELMSDSEVESLGIEELDSAEDSFEIDITEFAGKFIESNIQERIPMFFRLCRRCAVFFSFMLMALSAIFYIGNAQNFLESDLKIVLQVATIDSIMLALMCLSSFLGALVSLFLRRKIRYFFYSLAFVAVFAAAVALSLISRSISMVSDGFFG